MWVIINAIQKPMITITCNYNNKNKDTIDVTWKKTEMKECNKKIRMALKDDKPFSQIRWANIENNKEEDHDIYRNWRERKNYICVDRDHRISSINR